MILFWLTCLWLTGAAFAFVFRPSRTPADSGLGNSTPEANADVYREQLAELHSDWREGRIAQERFLRERDELEVRLAADLRSAWSSSVKSGRAGNPAVTVSWLGVLVSLGAVLLYLAIGSPSLIPQPH